MKAAARPAITRPALWIFLVGTAASLLVGIVTQPTWQVKTSTIAAPEKLTESPVPEAESVLWEHQGAALLEQPAIEEELVQPAGEQGVLRISAHRHWGPWSLLPAFFALAMCFALREPISALACGVVSSALVMGNFDITGDALIPAITKGGGVGIVILYLWLLGGILGLWARSGAARAFAEWAGQNLVKGPISAKLVTWGLGIIFFQGGTLSTVLVGTTVKPIADRQKISHEELAYVVDSTASPIAILIPLNAWLGYVASLIFVPGVAFLATESAREKFFLTAIPLSFYAIFAVFFTFLLSIDKLPFLSRGMRESIRRARAGEGLDRPDAQPLGSLDLGEAKQAPYPPKVLDFVLPLLLILGVAIGTFIWLGSPRVHWAFGAALLVSFFTTIIRGMRVTAAIDAIIDGMKGVVGGSVVLLLAIALGQLSRAVGAGVFLSELLGDAIPLALLPAILFAVSIFMAFSTGTSWGTFALAFPLGLPLGLAAAQAAGIQDPTFFMAICFATILNGAVFGDQCSPISDTTVLSSLSTGCDVMDHVRTQLFPSCIAAGLAVVLWTALAAFAVS